MGELINMPKLDMSMENGTIVAWIAECGDHLKTGEAFVEIETGKVSIELEASAEGAILEVYAQPGDIVDVGRPLCYVGLCGETPPDVYSLAQNSRQAEFDLDLAILGASEASYSLALIASRHVSNVAVYMPESSFLGIDSCIEALAASGSGTLAGGMKKLADLEAQMLSDLNSAGARIYKGPFSIQQSHAISCQGHTLSAKEIAMALNPEPKIPAWKHQAGFPVLCGKELMSIKEIPEYAVVEAKGPTAIHAAYWLSSMGAKTALVTGEATLMPGSRCQKAQDAAIDALEQLGVLIYCSDESKSASEISVTLNSGIVLPCSLYFGAFGWSSSAHIGDSEKSGLMPEDAQPILSAPDGSSGVSQLSASDGKALAARLYSSQYLAPQIPKLFSIIAPIKAVWAASASGPSEGRYIATASASSGEDYIEVEVDKRFCEIIGFTAIGPNALAIASLASLAMAGEASALSAGLLSAQPGYAEAFFEACLSACLQRSP
ncbi:MAG: lipoyl domain-containing protein [Eubacteriaceae bacterium]|nr:lipoyl domain-containing protein [Eubacteriaceae bacterium]